MVKGLLISLIRLYQLSISPLLVVLVGHGCKFRPTCSEYAVQSVRRFGPVKGGKMAIVRFLQCR